MFFMWSARLTRLNFCWLVKCFYNQIMFPPQIQVFGWVKKKTLQQKLMIDENLHAWNQSDIQMSLDSKLIPQWNHQKFNGEQRSIDLEVIRVMRECGARVGLNRRGSDHQDALMLVIIGTPGGVCCYYFQHLIVTNLSFIPWNKAKTKLGHDTTIWIDCW